jgi:hydroxyacylglutathione hydrolase
MDGIILEVFPSGPFETNAILLGCSKTKLAAVIDTPLDSLDLVLERAKELSLQITMVLFTHSHWDHIADAAAFKEKLGVPLYIHESDAGNLENPGSDKLPLFFTIKGVKPDGFIKDGDELALGEIKMRVIHTPGHTPGGVCFYLEKEGVLLSGDTLFKGTIGNLSFPTARPKLMWESLKKLSALPGKTRVFPGHGEDTTIEAEKWIAHAQDRFS